MSSHEEIDLSGVRAVPLRRRKNKVGLEDLSEIPKGKSFAHFWNSLPNQLAAKEIKVLVEAIRKARERKKPIIWFMGAHVIKVGLSPIIIDLIKRGFITAIGLNGAGMIHDVELAMVGGTSEDVGEGIRDGVFGMAKETAELLNGEVLELAGSGMGLGEAAGAAVERGRLPHRKHSILAAAYRSGIPCTVHIAIGTDIVHEHPSFDPAAAATASYRDFKIMVRQIAGVSGGVIMNVGSSVILPLIIEKGLSISRNLGHDVKGFTGANLDFIRHYRPQLNPVQRALELGGTGITLVGHHEINVPLIYWALRAG
ncbi:MAG: hypothetical protein ABIH66_00260 [bacterium]